MSESTRQRLRLNWFSPLRPARTDVAQYAARTLLPLASHFDIVVWTDRPHWPPELEAYARVQRWEGESWAALNSADATLYHLGNNARFHGWIWDVAQRHPGIVVLHDTRLHEFFAAQLLDNADDPTDYLNAIRRCHGDAAAAQAARLLKDPGKGATLGESLPMTDLALERARGAVVHSGTAFAQVAALGRCSVAQLDLPYEAGPPVVQRDWARDFEGVLRLVVFGYLGANRRLESLLEAMASFPERHRLHLEILGELEHPHAVTDRIQALAVGDVVQVRGFMSEADLDAVLDRSHLAVNLRYPTMGEASGSQLRIWSRGLASLVTRTGWYAELPPESVLFVDPQNEAADLHRHFAAALENPSSLRAIGEAGRRHLEARHAPELYASELALGIEQMMRTPASIVEEGVAAVSRVLTDSGIAGPASAALARRAAEELSRWLAPPDADPNRA